MCVLRADSNVGYNNVLSNCMGSFAAGAPPVDILFFICRMGFYFAIIFFCPTAYKRINMLVLRLVKNVLFTIAYNIIYGAYVDYIINRKNMFYICFVRHTLKLVRVKVMRKFC